MMLSILICTIPSRVSKFTNLLNHLKNLKKIGNYSDDNVEILWDGCEHKNIGDKRNNLLDLSKGDFVVFIDDDDMVTNDYLSLIMDAIQNNPYVDCIGLRGHITFNGQNRKNWSISIHNGYWHETHNEYKRTPNHISPIKREHSIKAKFSSKNHGEDLDYSNNVLQYLKKEYFIDKDLYHYDFYNK